MAIAALTDRPSHHPWIDVFMRDPAKGFADLLAGYARIHPYDRADPPDAARMLFGPLPPEGTERQALGQAVTEWVRERRQRRSPRDPSRRGQWIAEIQEAFEIVAALDLFAAATALRRDFDLITD